MGTLNRRFATRLLPGSLRSNFLKSIRKNDVADVKRTLQVRLLIGNLPFLVQFCVILPSRSSL